MTYRITVITVIAALLTAFGCEKIEKKVTAPTEEPLMADSAAGFRTPVEAELEARSLLRWSEDMVLDTMWLCTDNDAYFIAFWDGEEGLGFLALAAIPRSKSQPPTIIHIMPR